MSQFSETLHFAGPATTFAEKILEIAGEVDRVASLDAWFLERAEIDEVFIGDDALWDAVATPD